MTVHTWLVVILRLAGCVTLAAFPAMLLPVDWMAATHARLGLGEFPRAPVVVIALLNRRMPAEIR